MTTTILEQARINVAKRYPEIVAYCPSKGVPVYNSCYRGIMSGAWDTGKLVTDEVARLTLMALPENVEE